MYERTANDAYTCLCISIHSRSAKLKSANLGEKQKIANPKYNYNQQAIFHAIR